MAFSEIPQDVDPKDRQIVTDASNGKGDALEAIVAIAKVATPEWGPVKQQFVPDYEIVKNWPTNSRP